MRRRTARKKRPGRQSLVSLGGPPSRRGSGWVVLVLGALVVVNLYVFVWDKKTPVGAIKREAEAKQPVPAALPPPPLPTAPPPAAPGSATTPAPVAPPGTIDGKVGKSDTLGRLL